MLHDRPIASTEIATPTEDIRAQLAAIIEGIDARFVQVGTKLATTVEMIDRIVQALTQIGTVFEQGEAAEAVRNLNGAAERMSGVSTQLAERTGDVRLIRSVCRTLNKHVEDVRKSLDVLKIYGMNVKIAASGAEEFVDFADRMQMQLLAGEVDVGGFNVRLAELEASLASMEKSDRLLAQECVKVVPQVPEQLIADASALLSHQRDLATLAGETGTLARSIQGNVCAILGAVQIGDITRQRLEHVLAACVLLEARLVDCDPAEGAAMRDHVMRMLSAQLFDTAETFRRETERLIVSMRGIEPQAKRLLALRARNDAGGDGQVFLQRLDAGISEADAMTAQLRDADRQAEETVRIIIDTVDDLSVRAVTVRSLRIDVQQMAINIGLRCRRREGIGRPVIVIANEIRGYSERLDATIDGVNAAAEELHAISLRMRDGSVEGDDGADGDLTSALRAIRESAQCVASAMAAADTQAADILDVVRYTADQFEASIDLGGSMEGIASALASLCGREIEISDIATHSAWQIMEEIGRSYTMAREREVHSQFGLAGVEILAALDLGQCEPDDDALFDASLF